MDLGELPPRYSRGFVAPDPAPSTAAGESWEAWLASGPWSLLLTGPTGTGKSMLAAEIYRRRGAFRLWVRASQVAGVRYSDEERAFWGRLCGCSLLVIDELGRDHRGGAWEAVGELLSTRWEREKATVVTTNLSAEDFARIVHAGPLLDRLADGWVIRMDGDSRRGG